MGNITETVATIGVAILGVAILALIVSRNSNAAGVIQAAASGFGNVLGVAISPVTGANVSPNLSYPGAGLGGIPPLPTLR